MMRLPTDGEHGPSPPGPCLFSRSGASFIVQSQRAVQLAFVLALLLVLAIQYFS